ncbi:malonate transporter subunit MadL [Bradyrhizobium sp. U531]
MHRIGFMMRMHTESPYQVAGAPLAMGEAPLTISGVALLAICTLLGGLLGDLLGVALGVKANVGGVGIAMMFLIAARLWLMRHGLLSRGLNTGVGFWGSFYIPIVVAMAAQQNVVAAAKGGPIVVLRAPARSPCVSRWWPCRLSGRVETMDEIEAREAIEANVPHFKSGRIG